ncbi:MAG: protein jag [Epsilonproteobacteria bacterium]|nr:protein jag [Campylobacterota bacterium]
MKRFEAETLEAAYAEAAESFGCSVTELEVEVIQHPSKGFLGFGRKMAIIVATPATGSAKRRETASEPEESPVVKEKPAESEKPAERETEREERSEEADERAEIEAIVRETLAESEAVREPLGKEREIFDNFYQEKPDIHAVVPEIAEKINRLFAHACFKIDAVEVAAYDEETVLVEINGEDAALLIGKEGYRYKALSHLLYNWIHGQYGFRLRLEIAEFLKNQEQMIENYLQPLFERVEMEGRAHTKVLDGILVQIALVKLRERFPDKYVAIRSNKDGGRYVIVNDFMERR